MRFPWYEIVAMESRRDKLSPCPGLRANNAVAQDIPATRGPLGAGKKQAAGAGTRPGHDVLVKADQTAMRGRWIG
jgi:hypothetical protein